MQVALPWAGPLIQIKWRRAKLTVMRNGLPPVGLIHLNSPCEAGLMIAKNSLCQSSSIGCNKLKKKWRAL